MLPLVAPGLEQRDSTFPPLVLNQNVPIQSEEDIKQQESYADRQNRGR